MKRSQQFPILTIEEEYALVRRAKRNDQKAVVELYFRYEAFMYKEALALRRRDTRAKRIRVEDLVMSCIPAFFRAIRNFRFNHPKQPRFLTYACWWIKSGMQRALPKWANGVYFSEGILKAIRDIQRLRESRGPDAPELTPQLLWELLGLKKDMAEAALRTSLPSVFSLEGKGSRDDDAAPLDRLAFEGKSPFEEYGETEARVRLEQAIAGLPPLEHAIIHFMFYRGMSLEEAGEALAPFREDRLGVSREGARQMMLRAIAKLRTLMGPEE